MMKFLEFDDTFDFPFYNHNPRMPKLGWFILLLSVPIALITYFIIGSVNEILGGILFCLIMLIPLLYFSNWNYSLMFRRPSKNEIILAVLMFLGYMLYTLIVGSILDYYALSGIENTAESLGVTLESTIALIFSMMGEELVKFIPLMFLMRLVYKFSNNRKLAIVISAIIILIGFGLMHYNPPYLTLISVLLLQGFGTIFEMYGYLKTKNIFVPYISHLLTDASIFIIMLSDIA